ncbi:EF-hand domain-containing protein [uncultured Lentibacter sp.]|uniref:EF-hand domain-containing protein n=1 Tax=uncultured Lentibacter sp. TaxID=1659309 RepID=UPI00262C3C8A|nr:EF-hand domain-containing protein [uncultured Lentibacter sp.]MCW1956095.1 EF-hand domain-containing protein [Roseobacter sp.]
MKKTTLTLAVLATLLTPMLARADMLADLDTNADGAVTIDELQAVYPDMTAESFSAMDINDDGLLDADEITAAEEAGLINQDS